MDVISPELLLQAYGSGIFPMGEEETNTIGWYAPDPRGVLPLDDFHVPGNLARLVRRDPFEVVSDRDFPATIRACADRAQTWITQPIIEAYIALHEMGHAHSVECWQDGQLVGGLYGVVLGGAFFGESMFYRVSNASKVALVHLVRQLRAGDFELLDVQYANEHLAQFGVVEIPRAVYQRRLRRALSVEAVWWPSTARRDAT